YELKFQGFSSELARVLERLVTAKRCFVVRSIGVDKAPTEEAQQAMMAPMMSPGMRYNRYAPTPPPAAAPRPQRPSNILLDENKLLIVLQVDAVRLKDAPPKSGVKPPIQQVAQAPE
ncbi:MAG TPA: Amuc_1100 family pilus-like protein, partial [Verrucomicrobiae bacterium]|nr:Amuc_1100 family pilus-like protein [Verrucomicrobiae bacterium]